tara:strand:- start:102 stop:473 length:372 start_codon:yes stop_codon:yes gene_type:complete
MFSHKKKRSLIDTTCGWMLDIQNRVGSGVAWPMTSQHRAFIELLEADEGDMTFEEWKKAATNLMRFHAMARNDIYDFATCRVKLDEEGHFLGDQAEWEEVSREVADVRTLLHFYRTDYGKEDE